MKRYLFAIFYLFTAALPAFSQGALLPALPPSFLNASGLVASGAKLCTTAAGGSTSLATYSDYLLSAALPNPITLNALGIPQTSGGASTAVYAQAKDYRVTLYAAGTGNTCNGVAVGAQIWQRDHVSGNNFITLLRVGDGTLAAPSLAGVNYTSTGLYWSTGPQLNFALGGVIGGHIGQTTTVLGNNANGTASNATVVGFQAGNVNMSGGNNTCVGTDACESTTTGFTVTAIGYNALRQNTTGASQTAIGGQAGQSDTTGIGNVYVGNFAGQTVVNGGSCTIVGYHAADAATSCLNGVFIGSYAGNHHTTGHENTCLGGHACDGDTTGNLNTAVGYGALNANATTSSNTAVGYSAGLVLTGGAGQNSFFGLNAGAQQTSGENNTFIGWNAGVTCTTCNNNTTLGTQADVAAAATFSIALGRASLATGSNQFVAGSVTAPITAVFFGEGVTDSTPVGATVTVTGGTGANIAGAHLTLAGGQGTGSGVGGNVIFQTSAAGGGGSTQNALTTRLTIDSTGLSTFTGTVAVPLLNVTTGGTGTISTGVGSVKMATANAATNVIWIPIAYTGTTYYVPGWTTPSP